MGLEDNILAVWKIGKETKISYKDIKDSPWNYEGWIEQLKINPVLLHATGNLDLYPKIQRRSEAWNRKTRRAIISCLMKKRPIGVITIRYDSKTGLYSMIDGSHRVSTILNFIKNGKEKYQGKPFNDLSVSQREKFLSCKLHVHIYKDITDKEASELFQQLNSGESLVEAERFNSYGNDISDLVRVIANNTPKTDLPPWAEKLLGGEKHKLFKLLGQKWYKRHSHEKIAYTVLYNIFTLYYGKKNIYDPGAANTEDARQKMYQKYGNFGDPSEGQWDEMAKDDPDFKLQIKIVQNWIRVLDTMYDLVAAAPYEKTSFGKGKNPGAIFWNLYHFILGLELECASKRSVPVIKDPKLLVEGFLKAHKKENVKKKDGTDSLYKSINGHWMPKEHSCRNKILMKSMEKVGHQSWGISIRDSRRSFLRSDVELKYLTLGGKSEISGKKMDLKDMDAHHWPIAYEDEGRSDYDNLQLLGREEHRDEHKPKRAA